MKCFKKSTLKSSIMNCGSTIFGAVIILYFTVTSWGAVPQLINYQGLLQDNLGNPVADGSYSVVFTIYNASSGGDTLWTQTYSVMTSDGLFTVLLGSGALAIPDTTFNDTTRYLGIKVGADPELAPRTRLNSVAYAYQAQDADIATLAQDLTCVGCVSASEVDATQVQLRVTGTAPGGEYITGINQNGTVVTAVDQAGTGTASGWTDDGTTIRLTDITDTVGIGTTNPSAQLDVQTGNAVAISGASSHVLGTGVYGSGKYGVDAVGTTRGVYASGGDYGVVGIASNSGGIGLYGGSTSGAGVVAFGDTGVYAVSSNGPGVVASGGTNGVEATGTARGVYATGGDYGVVATGGTNGVYGVSSSGTGTGVYALGGLFGVDATGIAFGVRGISTSGTGVYGNSSSGTGVLAYSESGTGVDAFGDTRGVYAVSTNGPGVVAEGGTNGVEATGIARGVYATGGDYGIVAVGGSTYGVYGVSSSGSGVYASGVAYGVYSTGTVRGIFGTGGAYGVVGFATSNVFPSYGIYGSNNGNPATTYAGYFDGAVHVLGNLSKTTGSFKIDHPLDPANKYLYHSFVESPDMMNIYNGNITLDAKGEATVPLPDWFGALNRDFRYQLTVIGDFAKAIISEKINENQFSIKTDKPNIEVSWQVTGIRQDAYANAHRIQVEEEKAGKELGKYLHPKEHGMPEALGINYEMTQKMATERKQQEEQQAKMEEERKQQEEQRVKMDPKH